MNRNTAALLAGVVAAFATTAAMVAGRSGVLGKTLDRDAVDWIDRTTGSRAVIGEAGTSAVEFANHLGASAAFGFGYEALRRRMPHVHPAARRRLRHRAVPGEHRRHRAPARITEGEVAAGPRKAGERLGLHVLQSVLTALVAERLAASGDA